MAERCTGCNRKIDPVVWSMCSESGHCYHCGAEIPGITIDALMADLQARKPISAPHYVRPPAP